jgi:TolA-binding protein
LANAEQAVPGDDTLQAVPGDMIHVTYQDERNRSDEARQIVTKVRCVEGNLGGVRVTRAQISDQELRVKTQLKTAEALTNIGNRYKEFGLQRNATDKYEQALLVCEEISEEAARLGGRLLEETYVQLWHIYYEMDRLELAAAMSQRLQREFPNSEFVDDALLKLADVSRKQGDLQRAIGIYSRLVEMPTSQLRGEAQYGIAECYELMAKAATGSGAAQLMDRAFQEYKKVFDSFPESGRVGEAVAKMADHYYKQKDYARAIDIFETVLADHPDAKFLDVILFNYGRCLYRMERKPDARRQFDQLISEYPESPLAADAKKISEALSKAGF